MGISSGWHTVEETQHAVSDAELVTAAQADPDAFAALYHRYLPVIYRYLCARVTSDDVAADLTQQVFLKALESLPRYRVRGLPFVAWLFRIARNAAIDIQRRDRRTVPFEQVHVADHPRDPDHPETEFLKHESTRAFDALIAGFDEDKRNILILRFAVGLTTREIAEIVGKREAAVRKQLSRMLHTLKERHDET
ncbi:MAG: sigma-70 family RNA polymerase sigma factor [Thermomicrobiales bacterium]|nr:sigma-70 family RNA polymerase sigma factor [Thermomicrobiales bacterium]